MESAVLDHVAIAVASIDDSLGIYRALGLEVEAVEVVPEQGVRVALLPVGDSRLELLEPIGPDTPIARHLERRGPGLHHICLRVPDIRAAMANLADQGHTLLSEEPQPGAHGCLVCFVHPQSTGGVLLELSQAAEGEG